MISYYYIRRGDTVEHCGPVHKRTYNNKVYNIYLQYMLYIYEYLYHNPTHIIMTYSLDLYSSLLITLFVHYLIYVHDTL